jgi:hypothetical protein
MSTLITKRAKGLGLKMVDAKKAWVIEVVQKDIKKAKAQDPRHCAFALACQRTDKKVRAAYFFRTSAWLEYSDRMVRYMLPSSIQKEIVSFDRGGLTAPGTYQLSPPKGSNSLGAARARSRKRRSHPKGNGRIKRKVIHRTESIRTQHDQS